MRQMYNVAMVVFFREAGVRGQCLVARTWRATMPAWRLLWRAARQCLNDVAFFRAVEFCAYRHHPAQTRMLDDHVRSDKAHSSPCCFLASTTRSAYSAIRRHQPPQMTVLDQVDCFVQCEVVEHCSHWPTATYAVRLCDATITFNVLSKTFAFWQLFS